MKAVVYERYGAPDVLELVDVPPPSIGRGDVLVRVTRAALNPKDALTRKGRFRALSGSRFPKRVGMDLAGVVEASGSRRFTPGERVFGFIGEVRYLRGTLAELVRCHERELALTPASVPDEAAAGMALVGLTALQTFRDVARLRLGQRLLVNGGSGGVGTAAIQIGRRLGAEVHTISSAANEPLCAELGADRTWSYPAHEWMRERPFDVIFDVFGNLEFHAVKRHLGDHGCFVSTVPSARRLVRDALSRWSPRQERLVVVRPRARDLTVVAGWLADGSLRTVIDSRYPLADVRAAFERLESRRARGKIVIEVA